MACGVGCLPLLLSSLPLLWAMVFRVGLLFWAIRSVPLASVWFGFVPGLWVGCLVADDEEGNGVRCVVGQYVTFCVAKGMLL